MSVILHYSTGFPTRLNNHPNLEEMLKVLGEPSIIQRNSHSTYIEWPPTYPYVPIPSYYLSEPWLHEFPRRRLVRITSEK